MFCIHEVLPSLHNMNQWRLNDKRPNYSVLFILHVVIPGLVEIVTLLVVAVVVLHCDISTFTDVLPPMMQLRHYCRSVYITVEDIHSVCIKIAVRLNSINWKVTGSIPPSDVLQPETENTTCSDP